MNILKNGCRYSDFNYFPDNWNTSRASLKKTWRIEYRFYDLNFKEQYPSGYPKVIKAGINRIKDLAGRQQLMRELANQEKDLLENQEYNPIINKRKEGVLHSNPSDDVVLLHSNIPFLVALKKALESKQMDEKTRCWVKLD
ncbi:MAG TPA: hypothetical protein VJ720_07855 [Chitinophaga sp.]|nr:hypothetical protein [Chitinophaga sp.]